MLCTASLSHHFKDTENSGDYRELATQTNKTLTCTGLHKLENPIFRQINELRRDILAELDNIKKQILYVGDKRDAAT